MELATAWICVRVCARPTHQNQVTLCVWKGPESCLWKIDWFCQHLLFTSRVLLTICFHQELSLLLSLFCCASKCPEWADRKWLRSLWSQQSGRCLLIRPVCRGGQDNVGDLYWITLPQPQCYWYICLRGLCQLPLPGLLDFPWFTFQLKKMDPSPGLTGVKRWGITTLFGINWKRIFAYFTTLHINILPNGSQWYLAELIKGLRLLAQCHWMSFFSFKFVKYCKSLNYSSA